MLRRGGRRARTAAVVLGIATAAGGLLAGHAIADTGGPTPAALAARAEPLVAGTPCSTSARACVDLDSQKAWLIDDGKVVRGPVGISSGKAGAETPIGHSFRVYRKEQDYKSQEFKLPNGQPAPMPWSVFFADGGIAFHAGDPARASSGCIHLPPADAKVWFEHLQIGDQVQVVKGAEERAARADS
jgi:lipoprotein-anchoring transpeptidase ErfK/SrfK